MLLAQAEKSMPKHAESDDGECESRSERRKKVSGGCGCGAASVRVKLLLIICLFVISGLPHQERGCRMMGRSGGATRPLQGQTSRTRASDCNPLRSFLPKGNKRGAGHFFFFLFFEPFAVLSLLSSSRSPFFDLSCCLPTPQRLQQQPFQRKGTSINYSVSLYSQSERSTCASRRGRQRKCRRGMVWSRTV